MIILPKSILPTVLLLSFGLASGNTQLRGGINNSHVGVNASKQQRALNNNDGNTNDNSVSATEDNDEIVRSCGKLCETPPFTPIKQLGYGNAISEFTGDDHESRLLNSGPQCGCSTCTDSVWNTFAGDHKCGDRISYLQSIGQSERDACAQVAGNEFATECGACDPNRCNRPVNNNNNSSGQNKCGGAVNSSSNSQTTCREDLWSPTGDSSMHCFAYGGSGDPCHLSNNNDPNDGRFKDPSACNGDTLYLWDEPDTQGRSYSWAGREWLEYSRRFPQQLQEFRAGGGKITSPLIKAGGSGVIAGNLQQFFNACGAPCSDPSNQAYIDIIAINAFCGDFNGSAGCRGGASFIYNEAVQSSSTFHNLPVYITNWSKIGTSNPQDQVEAIDAIEEFFPSNSVVERVYWFGATDFGGGSSNNILTDVVANGSTLGQLWHNKCNSL